MAHRTALFGFILLGLVCTCAAGQIVTVDGPDQLPKREMVSRDMTCADDDKCVDKRDLTLECRNGVSVQATIVQPIQARASLLSMTYKGKPVRDETLRTVNLVLNDRSQTAVVELDGYCGSYQANVYINTYTDAYLRTRHQQGATIMVSLTTDDQESVGVGPSH